MRVTTPTPWAPAPRSAPRTGPRGAARRIPPPARRPARPLPRPPCPISSPWLRPSKPSPPPSAWPPIPTVAPQPAGIVTSCGAPGPGRGRRAASRAPWWPGRQRPPGNASALGPAPSQGQTNAQRNRALRSAPRPRYPNDARMRSP